jgi:hypothetical protein
VAGLQVGAAILQRNTILVISGKTYPSLETLELHNQHVINVVTKERLLIMKMKDGWEPLCKFLGKPIPDEPFPWVNDSEAASNTASRIVLKLGLMWLGLFTGISLTAYGGMKLLRL